MDRPCRLKLLLAVPHAEGKLIHTANSAGLVSVYGLQFHLGDFSSPKYKVTNMKSSVTKGLGVAQIKSYR